MKSAFVAGLEPEQTVTTYFLVCEKEVKATRDGKSYLRMELGDRSGTIDATMWDSFAAAAGTISRDDFVKVQARVETYRGKVQLKVSQLRRAETSEIELGDYFPHTKEDVEALYTELAQTVVGMSNPWLKKLASSVVEDPAMVPRLKRAPAAKVMHHAYLGGLLEHVISLCRLCRAAAAHYPEVDLDLLLTGAVLHDIGKVEELSYERSFGYTTEGQLLGHILIEYEAVSKRIDDIAGFPPELRTVVLHLVASHHGRYEFGSPVLPQFREAVLLHYLDDLDSKMAAMRATLASDQGEGDWTSRNASLERKLLRAEQYLAGAAGKAVATAAGQTSAGPSKEKGGK